MSAASSTTVPSGAGSPAPVSMCNLDVSTTLPLVCICSLFSFLCGVGIGANDLSANFAMVVGSGSLNMKSAIIYCAVFEILGAAFMGGKVSNTIRSGIVQPILFTQNRDLVVVGMTCATFAAALWLYMSTVFGLPVSITHTVVGSLLGFAIFSTWSFDYVKLRGLAVIVTSWVAAPLFACIATATIFYLMRRDVFLVKGRSFELALRAMPYCLATSLLVDYFFILIERPPIMSQTLARYVPLGVQYFTLFACIVFFCVGADSWVFPYVAKEAWEATSFVWESQTIRTEAVILPPEKEEAQEERLQQNVSFFKPRDTVKVVTATAAGTDTTAAAPQSTSTPSAAHTPQSSATRAGRDRESTTAAPAAGASTTEPFVATARSQRSVSRSRPPTPLTHAVSGASFVMSSIRPTDGRIVHQSSVRLAPTGRRSPVPSCGGTDLNATHNKSFSSAYYHFAPLEMEGLPTSTSSSLPTVPPRVAGGSGEAQRPLLAGQSRSAAATYGTNAEPFTVADTPMDIIPPTRSQPTPPSFGAPHNAFTPTSSSAVVPICDTAGGEAGSGAPCEQCGLLQSTTFVAPASPSSPRSVRDEDEFGDEDWEMDHPMEPIRFGGLLIKPFNPRAEYLFTGLQVVAGSMSSFVHGAVAGANATATFVILYEAFTNHELGETDLSASWSVLPAMLGIAIGMFALGATLMKTVGVELVTLTPLRGWCIQVGGTIVTMILTGLGIPVSLSQAQVGAAIGCGVLDAKLKGVSWGLVGKIIGGWVVTLVISAATTGLAMWFLTSLLC